MNLIGLLESDCTGTLRRTQVELTKKWREASRQLFK